MFLGKSIEPSDMRTLIGPAENHGCQGVAFSHGGARIAFALLSDIKIFECSSGKLLGSIPNHGNTWDLAFTPDDELCVCRPLEVEVWDCTYRTRKILFQSDQKFAFCLSCSKNGIYFAYRQANQVSVYAIANGKHHRSFRGRFDEAVFSGTGNSIILGSEALWKYKSRIHSLRTGERIATQHRKLYLPRVLLQSPASGELTLYWKNGSEARIDNLTTRVFNGFAPFQGQNLEHVDATFHGDLTLFGTRERLILCTFSKSIRPGPVIDFKNQIDQLALSPTGAHIALVFASGVAGLLSTGYKRPSWS